MPPAPVCHPRRHRSLFLLCDRNSSSTAECRLSLCISQLLCECQLHARAAHQPLPCLNTTHFHLKDATKESNLCFAGLGEAWGGILYVCSYLFVFFILKRQNKLQVIKTSASFLYGHIDTRFGSLRHYVWANLDVISQTIIQTPQVCNKSTICPHNIPTLQVVWVPQKV